MVDVTNTILNSLSIHEHLLGSQSRHQVTRHFLRDETGGDFGEFREVKQRRITQSRFAPSVEHLQ